MGEGGQSTRQRGRPDERAAVPRRWVPILPARGNGDVPQFRIWPTYAATWCATHSLGAEGVALQAWTGPERDR